ncbi:protein kinase [Streptomyces sp. NPDC020807]|uniref:protein kinase domain-containing protein n=1 Tax=Streptomyces sp. NPDC020807 TaxID=3155119 RepID=UPI0033F59EBE
MTVIAGRYRLLDVLAEGATGTVWRALDETRVHEVALKEFRAPDGLPADELPLLYARLERGARAAARVSHPSVVTVHGVVTEDGRPWVVMELVRGLTLAETLEAGGPLPPAEAARVGAEVLAALRAARAAGAPHRGVRPGHVLLANDGRVVVTGFGAGPGTEPGAALGAGPGTEPGAGDGAPAPEAELRDLGALLGAATEGGAVGALGPVLDGLRGDASPTADQLEGLLRRLASDGPRGEAKRGASSPPPASVRAGAEEDASARPGAVGPGPVGRGARPPRRSARPRRGPVLLAGIVGAVLLAGALTYEYVREGDADTGPGRGGVTSTVTPSGSGGSSATPLP